jgi:hypothetical protein
MNMTSTQNLMPARMETAPETAPSTVPPAVITQTMMDALRGTKPWVRFLAIMGFISSGFIISIGLVFALGAGIWGSFNQSALGKIPAILIGCVYMLLGLVCLFPAVSLFRYADGIQKALAGDWIAGVEQALRNQKSFWTFVGVFVLIALVLQVLMIAFLVLAGIVGLAGLRGVQG